MSGSFQYGDLCSLILKETYGTDAETVGMTLFRHGTRTLGQLVTTTGLDLAQVRRTLLGLCNYNLIKVSTATPSSSAVSYSLKAHHIIFVQRYIRSVPLLTGRFGSEGEILLDTLMKCGCCSASSLLLQATSRLVRIQEGRSFEEALLVLWERFGELLDQGFVCRASEPSADKKNPLPTDVPDDQRYRLPIVELGELRDELERGEAAAKHVDDKVLWRIKRSRITQLLRDEMFANAIASRVDEHAGNLIRVLMTYLDDFEPWAPASKIVTLTEVKGKVRKMYPGTELESFLEDYLQILVDDSSGLVRVPEFGCEGTYQVTVKPALEELSWSAAERLVHEQFGSRGAHIFRVVRLRRHVDQDQIQEAAMLPAREAKQMTYRLMDASLLQVREVRLPGSGAGPDMGPRRAGGAASYLFYINFMQLVRTLLERCHVAQRAALLRRLEVCARYDYLFSKQQQMDACLAMDVSPEQAALIDDILTASERRELNRVTVWRERLSHAEYDLDESTLLFDLFLRASIKVMDPVK